MDLLKLSVPLDIKDVEFRVQQVLATGHMIVLAYKDARVDMARLDEAVGPLNWQRKHSRDNANCTIEIWNEKIGQWISKEDTGTESNTEQKKGLASDSFKRAGFNWGIGRELYDYPFIYVQLNAEEFWINENKKDKYGNPTVSATKKLRLKDWKWYVEFEGKKPTFLAAQDNNKKTRFTWGSKKIVPAPIN
jgi:hypothetical protein